MAMGCNGEEKETGWGRNLPHLLPRMCTARRPSMDLFTIHALSGGASQSRDHGACIRTHGGSQITLGTTRAHSRFQWMLRSHIRVTENWRAHQRGKSLTELHTMASGTGISSNSGQGAEEYPQAIILEVEEIFSDTSSESESEDEVPLIPEAEQQRHSVPDDGTRVRRRFPKVKRHAEFQTLRTRRRFPKAKRDAESQTWRAMRRFPNGEVDAQFHSLRAMLRPSIKRVPKDRFSIMMTAYHYAMDLRLSIDNIKYQLDSVLGTNSTPGVPLVRPSPQREPFGIQMPRMRAIDAIPPMNPVVEVLRDPLRGNGQVKLKIACANRTDLIHDFRAALEETCLSLVEGTFGCVNGTDFHANVWLEKFTPETTNDVDWNPRPQPLSQTAEDGALKELMLFVIRQDTPVYVHH